MKVKRIIPILTVFLLVWSCATAPKPAEKPADTTPTDAQVGAKSTELPPTALLERAKELKKKAFDLTLFEIMPDEYKAADGFLTEGVTTYEKDNGASKASLEKSVAAFTDLIERGTVLLSAKRREQADAMKEAALKAGAGDSFPAMTEAGDALYAEAAAKEEAKDHEAAAAGFVAARIKYETAMKKAQGSVLRDRIETLDFAQYDQGNFDLANGKYAEIDEYFETDAQKSLDAADESLLRFNLVLRKGFEFAAGTNRQKTEAEKEKADGIKSSVAVKDEYAQALAVYEEGIQKQDSQDFETAADKFAEAETLFADAYALAREKRDRAEAAIKELESAKAESERKADDAATKLGEPK